MERGSNMKTLFFAVAVAALMISQSAMADGIEEKEEITITKDAEVSETEFVPDSEAVTDAEPVVETVTETVTVTRAATVKKQSGMVEKNPDPRYKKSRLVPALIVTSNYAAPRALCELAAKHSGVPYLLLPAETPEPDGEQDVIFVSSKGVKILDFKAKDLSVFLAYLRPSDVIFLGDSEFVPDFYIKSVPANCNYVPVRDKYWQVNAFKLANHFNKKAIYDDFMSGRAASAKAEPSDDSSGATEQ